MNKEEIIKKLKAELENIILSTHRVEYIKYAREECGYGLTLVRNISTICDISLEKRAEIEKWFIDEINKRILELEKKKFDENVKKYIMEILEHEFILKDLGVKIINENTKEEIELVYLGKEYTITIKEKEKK